AQAESALRELEETPGQTKATATSAKSVLDGVKRFVDASSVWDLAVRINGTAVETEIVMGFSDPAKSPSGVFLKSDLAALAPGVPGDGMMSIALSIDGPKMWGLLQGFLQNSLEMYPPGTREAMKKLFESAGRGMGSMGPGMVMNGGFGPDGFEMTGVVQS